MTNIEFKKIIEAFENASYSPRSYSGRAMYGKECLGVVCNNVMDVIPRVIYELSEILSDENNMVDKSDVSDICEMFVGARTDSMGHDSIIYWPNIKWIDVEYEGKDEIMYEDEG